jgi:hypothetical protein
MYSGTIIAVKSKKLPMKSIFSFLFLLVITISAFSQKQKITVDDDIIKADGVDYAKIEKKSGLSFDFTIKSLDGTDLIYFKFMEYNNPNKVNSGNPNGRVTYYEVIFFGSGEKCEVQSPGTKKGVAKIVAENNLVKENAVDAEAEKKFILISGSNYSKEKESLNDPKVIIIKD